MAHAETKQKVAWYSKKRNKWIILAFMLLIVGIVVAVVIPLTGGGADGSEANKETSASSSQPPAEDDETMNLTPSPSSSPSLSPAPTSTYDRIFALISAHSGEDVLLDSTTPQSQAFQWVLGDFSSGGWQDDTILERYALACLFYGLDGFRWISVTDFVLEVSYCVWQGVECSTDDDQISSLALPAENLSGALPREIGLLPSLTSLDLSNNEALTGSIPTEIGFLTNLERLDLSVADGADNDGSGRKASLRQRNLEDGLPLQPSSSSLTGPIPSEIGRITSLASLDLSNNDLSGTIPTEIGLLENIKVLALRNNRLGGAIPVQLGFLDSLERLVLEQNLLAGGIPNVFCSSFSRIQELSSDCLPEVNGDKPAEVVCKCCNVCCDVNDICVDLDVTAFPSSSPSTSVPSSTPSASPSTTSARPSVTPSFLPSFVPSKSPSFNPTPSGTPQPTVAASALPSKPPTLLPSFTPSTSPTSSCPIDETSCIGNRACSGAIALCTESESCLGRNACRNSVDLSVSEGSCVGKSTQRKPSSFSHSICLPLTILSIAFRNFGLSAGNGRHFLKQLYRRRCLFRFRGHLYWIEFLQCKILFAVYVAGHERQSMSDTFSVR